MARTVKPSLAADQGSRSSSRKQPGDHKEHSTGFTQRDAEDIDDSSRLRAPMIYEILRREGEEEMRRPITSLWWSGVAAGLSISFSLLAQAILQSHLPDTVWRPLVTSFGYCVGFLIVVLARQQLFTENTITAVLPVTASPTFSEFGRLVRLWSIVFGANIAGTLFAALFCSFTPVVPPELRGIMIEISRHLMENSPTEMFFRAISAGFLIAAMVWVIPSAEGAKFHVVTLMTYLIAVGGFAHIVAGSFEAFMLLVDGQLEFWRMIAGFALPTLVGNVIGGTALFALISYAQVAKEV
jgi:formate/nitrite transporter FocA (FNT family)